MRRVLFLQMQVSSLRLHMRKPHRRKWHCLLVVPLKVGEPRRQTDLCDQEKSAQYACRSKLNVEQRGMKCVSNVGRDAQAFSRKVKLL